MDCHELPGGYHLWKSHVSKIALHLLTGACARTVCPLFDFVLSVHTLAYHSPVPEKTHFFQVIELAGFRMVALKFLFCREKFHCDRAVSEGKGTVFIQTKVSQKVLGA